MSNHFSATMQETPDSELEMTTEDFLALLRVKHIEVHASGDRLKVSAPVGAIDGRLQAQLKARKASLLEALRPADSPQKMAPLSAAELREKIPLTRAQQGIWLIDHFDPGNITYNIPDAFRIEQPIEVGTVQAAVARLVERHGILRTSFHEEDGELYQSIAETVETPVGFSDLSSLTEEESERSCREAIRGQSRRPFDLKQAPLVRFHLFRLAHRRHVVFLNIHHIIADRVSLFLIRQELGALIGAIRSEASRSGTEAALPEVGPQFADYAVWATRQMKSEAMERQIANWKKKLAGLPAPIELPHSHPRPERRSSLAATRGVSLSPESRGCLNRIGMEEGASPFMTFLAFFAVTLARWSRTSVSSAESSGPVDFCIGSPITHRRHVGTERMIGLFVNMLGFRCQIAPGMGFRDVLRQVRATALEAYDNSDVPFQQLVSVLNPDRRLGRSPIFQVMFGYEAYLPPVADDFPMEADAGSARYDLSLHLAETAQGGLNGVIEYCVDLFDAADIDTLAAEGEAVFDAILRGPNEDVFRWSPPVVAPVPASPSTPATEATEEEKRRMGPGAARMHEALTSVGRWFHSRR